MKSDLDFMRPSSFLPRLCRLIGVGVLSLGSLGPLLAQKTPAGGRWENAICEYEARDRIVVPAMGGILFVGSSSIAGWRTLPEDFASLPVLGRGFGGSMLADAVYYADRIVLPYKPRVIVLYSGSNDLAAGAEPGAVLAELKRFVSAVRAGLPAVRILYVSNAPNPSRWNRIGQIREANALIAAYGQEEGEIEYVDVFSHMLGADGLPRAELFIEDKLHMNAKGYALWAEILRPRLMEPEAASAAFATVARAGDSSVVVVTR
jgi:lysophospholipase L1-like esterase